MIKVNVTTFRHHYADGNCLWKVTEKRGRGTWIAEIKDDADYSGVKQAFTTEQIEGSIGLSKLWNNLADEGDKFYNNLVVGSTVHYNNGFNQFVRCKVMPDKQLLPVAMVGNWSIGDLPRRLSDGEICGGYYADKIKKSDPFKPNASNIYENKHDVRVLDPHNMVPINLELPPMTSDEQIKSAKVRKINSIKAICGNNDMTPDGKLDMIRNLLDDKAL